jgi:hypothetical protein
LVLEKYFRESSRSVGKDEQWAKRLTDRLTLLLFSQLSDLKHEPFHEFRFEHHPANKIPQRRAVLEPDLNRGLHLGLRKLTRPPKFRPAFIVTKLLPWIVFGFNQRSATVAAIALFERTLHSLRLQHCDQTVNGVYDVFI